MLLQGIVAFTFDEQAVAEMDVQLTGLESHGKGILSEFLEVLFHESSFLIVLLLIYKKMLNKFALA